MKKDPKVHIVFVLECIELIEEYLKDATAETFFSATQLQDAVIRRIELIGEEIPELKKKILEIKKELEQEDA